MNIEHIEAASQTAELLCQDLRQAIKSCKAVEAIVILQAIEDAARLRGKLDSLLTAMQEDAK